MSGTKPLQIFDNDYLFIEKMRVSQRENFANLKLNPNNADLTFSKTQFTKSFYETDPFTEDINSTAHLKYQHINNHKPLSKVQRLQNKIMINDSVSASLSEIYN